MKLYTEEQVKQMIDRAHNGWDGYTAIMDKFTPIYIPSDDEIYRGLCVGTSTDISKKIYGAEWIKEETDKMILEQMMKLAKQQ
jgi:hypothetical protein